jgi:hypothetical protein
MGVNLKGGPAGDGPKGGKHYSAPVPMSGVSQPIPITTTNAPDDTKYPVCKSTTPAGDRGNCVMPTGGSNPIEGGAQ